MDTQESTVTSEATVTFGPSAATTMLTELGYDINGDGVIVGSKGNPVESPISNEIVTLEEFAGFREDENGNRQIVKKNDPMPTTITDPRP